MWQALSLLQHIRLMGLLVCLALAAGLVFYVYSKAVYQSRALVRVQIVELPFQSEKRAEDTYRLRDFRGRFESRDIIEKTAQYLKLTKEPGSYESIRDTYIPKHSVSIVDGSTLAVEVFSYDRNLVAAWQPAMVEAYKQYAYELRKRQREELSVLYRDELASLAKQIDQQWREKFSFEQENSITELFVQQAGLTQLPREMVVTRQRLERFEQTRKALDVPGIAPIQVLTVLANFESDPDQGGRPPMTMPDPGRANDALSELVPRNLSVTPGVIVLPPSEASSKDWLALEKERQTLLSQVQEAQKTYLPGHRVMKELQASLDRVSGSLESQAQGARARFESEYSKVKASLLALEAQLPDYRDINRKYEEFRQTFALQQNRNLAWDEAYKAISKRLASMEYTGDAVPTQLEFLGFTLMRNEDPVSPPKMKLFYMSLALGLAMAIGVPFAMQKLSDRLSRLEEAQDLLQLTGLGVVPVYGRDQLEDIVRSPMVGAEHPDRLLEDFRLIRSSIALNRDLDIGAQAMMVTSARPGEGKSTIASNLAWAFASMGDKTLIVDCDLRRGRLHQIMDLPNVGGLSKVLSGQKLWEDEVQSTALPQLDVLVRGPFTPGLTERLCRDEFRERMDEWRQKYQRIILDTPPVLGLSEASSLQRVVDGTVLVILADQTPRRDVEQALEILRKSGARMYGFVLNRLDLRKAANYYQYSYYSPYYYEQAEESVR